MLTKYLIILAGIYEAVMKFPDLEAERPFDLFDDGRDNCFLELVNNARATDDGEFRMIRKDQVGPP